MTTVITPHILDLGQQGDNGAAPDVPGTGGSLWVLTQDGEPFPFHHPDSDATGPNAASDLQAVHDEYVSDDARRRCPVPDRPLAFAPSSQPGRRDGTLSTQAIHFKAQLDGGSFLPVLDHAEVLVDALQALLGGSDAVKVKLYDGYLSSDIDQNAGVFAELLDPSPVSFTVDQPTWRALESLPADLAPTGVIETGWSYDAGAAPAVTLSYGLASAGVLLPSDTLSDVAGAGGWVDRVARPERAPAVAPVPRGSVRPARRGARGPRRRR